MPVRRPQLQLRVSGRSQLQQAIVPAIVELDGADRLRVASIEALSEAQNRGERADRAPPLLVEVAVALVAFLRRRLPVIPRDERHGFDLVGLETAEVAVPDQVVGVLVMPFVADMHTDVVQQRGILQPFALTVRQPVDAARLIE